MDKPEATRVVGQEPNLDWWKWALPLIVGATSWMALSLQADGKEAWDGGAPYFTVSFAVSFVLGLLVATPWYASGLPGVLYGLGQFAAALITAEEYTFILLGLLVFLLLSVVFGMVSFVGAAFRRRFWSSVVRTSR
jgi:hypothetical protein